MMLIQNGDQTATAVWDKLNIDRNLLKFATELGVMEGVWDPNHFRRVIEVDWQVTTKQPVDGKQVHKGILEWIDTSQLALNVNGQSRVVPLDALIDGVINRNRDSEVVMNLSLDEFLAYQQGEWRVLTEEPIDGERMHVGTLYRENGDHIQISIGGIIRTIPLNQIKRMAIKKPARNQVTSSNNPWIEPEYYHVLKTAVLEAQRLETETVDTSHLLLAITKMHRSAAARLLAEFDVTYETLKSTME
jgi:hypothetical protein